MEGGLGAGKSGYKVDLMRSRLGAAKRLCRVDWVQDRSGAEKAWRRAGLVQGRKQGVHVRVSELWEAASASISAAPACSS